MAIVLPLSDPTVAALNFAALMNNLAQLKVRQTANKIAEIELRHTQDGIMSRRALDEATTNQIKAETHFRKVATKTAELMQQPNLDAVTTTTETRKLQGKGFKGQERRAEGSYELGKEKTRQNIATDRAREDFNRMGEQEAYLKSLERVGIALAGQSDETIASMIDGLLQPGRSRSEAKKPGDTETSKDGTSGGGGSAVGLPPGTGEIDGMAASIAQRQVPPGTPPGSLAFLLAKAAATEELLKADQDANLRSAQVSAARNQQVLAAASSQSAMKELKDDPLGNEKEIEWAYDMRHFGVLTPPKDDQIRVGALRREAEDEYGNMRAYIRQEGTPEEIREDLRRNKRALAKYTKDGDKKVARAAIARDETKLRIIQGSLDKIRRIGNEIKDIPWFFPYEGDDYGPKWNGRADVPGPISRSESLEGSANTPEIRTAVGIAETLATDTTPGGGMSLRVAEFKKKPLTDFGVDESVSNWDEFPKEPDQKTYLQQASAAGMGSAAATIHFQDMLDKRRVVQANAALKRGSARFKTDGGVWKKGESKKVAWMRNGVLTIGSRSEREKALAIDAKKTEQLETIARRLIEAVDERKNKKTSVASRTGEFPPAYYSGGS